VAVSYAAYVATTWCRFGRVTRHVGGEDRDALLDQFMPTLRCASNNHRHHLDSLGLARTVENGGGTPEHDVVWILK
jgi:hypothetical protein